MKYLHRKHPARLPEIELGLELLLTLRVPDARFSQYDIAHWCCCSQAMIWWIVQRALKKIRQRLSAEVRAAVANQL